MTTDSLYHRPAIFSSFPELTAAESLRQGGVSPAPFFSLNLGFHTPDSPENVHENRRLLVNALGFELDQLAESRQVHGNEVLIVEKGGSFAGHDALITNQTGVLLGVKAADCTPILIYDSRQRVLGAAHAGWRGTASKIVENTLAAMRREFGTEPGHCYAYVGTCIDAESYEVDADVADQFPETFKVWDGHRGKYLLDLKAANQYQLIANGVPPDQVSVSQYSTVLNNDIFFSHRKEKGKTGRQMALIGLKG